MDALTVGRAPDNSLVINDASVSRYHARIYYSSGKWNIVDLNSTHGTTVNGKKIDGPVTMKPSDTIMLSEVKLYFDGRAIFSAQGKQLLVLNKPAASAVAPGLGGTPPVRIQPGRVTPGRPSALPPKRSKLPAIAGITALLLFLIVVIVAISGNNTEPQAPEISIRTPPPPQAVVEHKTIPYEGGEYTGWLSDGVPHGQGTLKFDAVGRSSAFVDLLLHRGTKAKMYDGEWQNGLKHGYGKMTHSNGRVEEGYWEYGHFTGLSGD